MKSFNVILLASDLHLSNRPLENEYSNFCSLLIKNGFNVDESGIPLFYIGSGGSENKFIKIYKEYGDDFLLVATDHDNSLPASLEILSFLNINHLKGHIFHGTFDCIINQLKCLDSHFDFDVNNRVLEANNILMNKRYGIIGRPSDWLISSSVNYDEVYQKFGCQLIDISDDEIVNIANKYHLFLDKNSDVQLSSILILKALEEIVFKYKLDGLTIRCFDLLDKMRATSCYALSILNKRGIIATCEGDIPSLLSMAIIRELTNQSSFQANPSLIDIVNNEIVLAHCTIPLDMVDSYEITTHFESGIGNAIKGILPLKKVFLFKLHPNLNEFFFVEGEIVSNLHSNYLCRTQIKVKTTQEVASLLNYPFANHLILFYGDGELDSSLFLNKLSKT